MKYFDILKELSVSNIRYLLCGGLAVNIYGIPRMTADIDIILDFEVDNLKLFEKSMQKLGYLPSAPIKLIDLANPEYRLSLFREKNMIALSLQNSNTSFFTLDVLLSAPIPFDELWQNRDTRESGGATINLLSISHLIQMKNEAGREQDKQDANNLKRFLGNTEYGK